MILAVISHKELGKFIWVRIQSEKNLIELLRETLSLVEAKRSTNELSLRIN